MDRGLVSNYAEQIRGVSYKPNDLHDGLDKDSVILLRANNIDDGKINFDDVVYVDRKKVSKSQYLQKGDILICASSGSKNLVGKAASVDFGTECTFGAFCKVVRPTKVTPEFLGLFFQSPSYRRKISALAQGANINNIKNEHIDNLQLAIYSEREQRQIIERLTRVITIIHARKDELSKLDELIKARFVEMFGDPQINPKGYKKETLNKHADVFVGYPFKSEGYAETGIRIVGGYNLMQGYIVWNECKHWPALRGYEQYLLQNGDIVMAMDRPWVNGGFKIASVDEGHLPALLIQRTACIRVNDVEQEFLYELLNSNRFAEHCNITGSLVPHISNKDINSYEIILPPIAEQKEFSEFVQQVDKSKAVIQKALDETQILFDSLMQEYFG